MKIDYIQWRECNVKQNVKYHTDFVARGRSNHTQSLTISCIHIRRLCIQHN